MVMMVFTLPSYDVVFKVIKDRFDYPKTTTKQDVRNHYYLVFKHDRGGRLVEAHAAGLALYARQWCAAPEDVVQEAFLKLMALPHPPNQPVAWLYRVVRNAAISSGRSERRRRHYESTAAAVRPDRGK